jgi:hypothetical protein
MHRTLVVSKTGMCGVGYDAATQTIEIAFKAKKEGDPEKVYQYTPFTEADWKAFKEAPSMGSHFLRVIKPNFACKKIEPEKPAHEKEATQEAATS